MKFKVITPSAGRLLCGLLVLASTITLSTQKTTTEFLNGVKAGSDLECYVCNSAIEACKDTKEMKNAKCKDLGENGYLQLVYGSEAVEMSAEPNSLLDWPPSLSVSKSENSSGNASSPSPGWSDASFPGDFHPAFPPPMSSFKYSDLSEIKNYDKGYKSCRMMKIWVSGKYLNDGKLSELPESNPRIVRTCSVYAETGCKTIKTKTTTTDVCYCKGNKCNGSSYLRISQYWILAASLLVFVANLGINMH